VHWEEFKVEWMTVDKEIVGEANYPKRSRTPVSKLDLSAISNPFGACLFWPDPNSKYLSLPVDCFVETQISVELGSEDDDCMGIDLANFVLSRGSSLI
jgi:hypothetical protein